MTFIVLSSWQAVARVHPVQLIAEECRLKLLPSTSTIAIYYYSNTKLKFTYRHTQGRRLSRPTHCSKGVLQPVPKAVYRRGCRDKHTWPQFEGVIRTLVLSHRSQACIVTGVRNRMRSIEW